MTSKEIMMERQVMKRCGMCFYFPDNGKQCSVNGDIVSSFVVACSKYIRRMEGKDENIENIEPS